MSWSGRSLSGFPRTNEASPLPISGAGGIAASLGEDLHVWLADLDRPASGSLPDGCSDDERDRASGFASPQDGKRFLAARAILRALLSAYTGQAAERIAITLSDHGKPGLAGDAIRFNLSHSGSAAAFVICAGREVGVDIQRIRPVGDLPGVARSLFSQREIAHLEELSGAARQAAFFRYWVCREAVLKAVGTGIDGATDIELEEDGEAGMRLVSAPEEWAAIEIRELRGRSDVLGAVAWPFDGSKPPLRCFELAFGT